MSCIDWEERIALHAGGDLEDDAVERHLAECVDCRDLWDGLRETLGALREAHAEEIPAAHFTAVRAGVIAEIERRSKVWRRLAWVSGVGIAAALVLGLAMRPGPMPGPPPRIAMRIPEAPPAPVIARSAPVLRRRQSESPSPLVVKLQTADPNIVIYWIGEY